MLVRFESALEAFLQDLIKESSSVATFRDALGYTLGTGGKRLRPLLFLGLSEDLGLSGSKAVSVAAALELIHTSTLIHDDLPALDNDDYRRGKPSLHRAMGEATAILSGDALIGLISRTIGKLEADPGVLASLYKELLEAYFLVCEGQFLDLNDDYRSEEWLSKVHSLKTGALFSATCVSAGLVAGMSNEINVQLRAIGKTLGLYFQLVDDFLDFFAVDAITGKRGSSDTRNGRRTLFSEGKVQRGFQEIAAIEERLDALQSRVCDAAGVAALSSLDEARAMIKERLNEGIASYPYPLNLNPLLKRTGPALVSGL